MSIKIRRMDHPSRRRWRPEEVRLLGVEPDLHIARKLAIGPATVAAERRRRGIPPVRSPFNWTEEALALLGMDSDPRIAALLGISIGMVSYKRRLLEIPACFPRHARRAQPPNPFWTPARVALLGTASDAVIARRLGVSGPCVAGHRRKLGIPPACPIPRHDWGGIDRLLGKLPDAQVAARFGFHVETVRRRRLNLGIGPSQAEHRTIRRDRALRRLLERPTAEIREVSSSAAAALRQELGVRHPPRRSRWTRDTLRRLGKVPDAVIARELGLSLASVRAKRRALGLRLRQVRRWTSQERALVARVADDAKAARLLARTVKAVKHERRRAAMEAASRPRKGARPRRRPSAGRKSRGRRR